MFIKHSTTTGRLLCRCTHTYRYKKYCYFYTMYITQRWRCWDNPPTRPDFFLFVLRHFSVLITELLLRTGYIIHTIHLLLFISETDKIYFSNLFYIYCNRYHIYFYSTMGILHCVYYRSLIFLFSYHRTFLFGRKL